jgi:hypothetical protein
MALHSVFCWMVHFNEKAVVEAAVEGLNKFNSLNSVYCKVVYTRVYVRRS